MSGTVFTICPPTLFDFGNIKASGGPMGYALAMRVPIEQFESGVLAVRVHAHSAFTGTDSIDVVVSADGWTPDDPALDFSANNVGTALASISVLNATGSPDFLTANMSISSSNMFGQYAKVFVRGTRNNAGVTALNAKLSIDLVLKTGGAATGPMARRSGIFMGYLPDLS